MTEFVAAATPSGKSQVIRDDLIWQTARDRLPLPMLMTKMGDGAFTVKGAACPFCHIRLEISRIVAADAGEGAVHKAGLGLHTHRGVAVGALPCVALRRRFDGGDVGSEL